MIIENFIYLFININFVYILLTKFYFFTYFYYKVNYFCKNKFKINLKLLKYY